MKLPPKSIEPAALFRELSSVPRASRKIDHRIRGAEGIELSVQSLSSHEFFLAKDAAGKGQDNTPYIVAACLFADGERAFCEPSDVFGLIEEEVRSLFQQVASVFSEISPIYCMIDYDAWLFALLEGSKHPSNLYTAYNMALCVDNVVGAERTITHPRPDLYYGLPMREITDGQILAYFAGKRAIDEIRKAEEK